MGASQRRRRWFASEMLGHLPHESIVAVDEVDAAGGDGKARVSLHLCQKPFEKCRLVAVIVTRQDDELTVSHGKYAAAVAAKAKALVVEAVADPCVGCGIALANLASGVGGGIVRDDDFKVVYALAE